MSGLQAGVGPQSWRDHNCVCSLTERRPAGQMLYDRGASVSDFDMKLSHPRKPQQRRFARARIVAPAVSRYACLGAVCAYLAGAPLALAAAPPVIISGGGAVASSPVIIAELALMNDNFTRFQFSQYYPVTSTVLQTALLNNDATQFGLAAGAINVDFGATEQPLTPAQIWSWGTLPTGKSVAGNLIQVPLMGAGLAIAVKNAAVTANGQVVLSDNQLCGIFSGQITDWSQLGSSFTPGTITVVYRPDSAAVSYQLTQHLAAVCNSSNSAFPTGFQPSTYFATIFGTRAIPANFKAVKGLAYVAQDMNLSESSAITYLSPDWTTIAPNSTNLLPSGGRSKLLVAALTGAGSKPYLPSLSSIELGLSNPGPGSINITPPSSQSNAANPANWLPSIPTTTRGYPIVSYSAFLMPQCFAKPAIANGLRTFLLQHYQNSDFLALQNRNGYVGLQVTPAYAYLPVIKAIILNDRYSWGLKLGSPAGCAGLAGR